MLLTMGEKTRMSLGNLSGDFDPSVEAGAGAVVVPSARPFGCNY